VALAYATVGLHAGERRAASVKQTAGVEAAGRGGGRRSRRGRSVRGADGHRDQQRS